MQPWTTPSTPSSYEHDDQLVFYIEDDDDDHDVDMHHNSCMDFTSCSSSSTISSSTAWCFSLDATSYTYPLPTPNHVDMLSSLPPTSHHHQGMTNGENKRNKRKRRFDGGGASSSTLDQPPRQRLATTKLYEHRATKEIHRIPPLPEQNQLLLTSSVWNGHGGSTTKLFMKRTERVWKGLNTIGSDLLDGMRME